VAYDGPAERDAARPDTAEWKREHAHGLWIIDQLADQVSLDRHAAGTTVTVAFTISPPG
jgi:anti-sigma regulatory factor (Ser/Thr protein kinase)